MLELVARDSVRIVQTDPVTGAPVLDEHGEPIRIWVPIPVDMKLDAAKAVAKYLHPALMATAITQTMAPFRLPICPRLCPVPKRLRQPRTWR
jgi:hypothetical protein